MSSQLPNPGLHVIQMSTMASFQNPDDEFRANHAYKYYGYSAFSEFQASGNDYFLLRRFGKLNTRVLLNLQYKILESEKRLADLDERCRIDPSADVRSDSFKKDEEAQPNTLQHSRAVELDHLATLLKPYSKIMK
jgi:hypothetical protein